MTPRQIGPDDPALAEVLRLIQNEFAYMDGVIDPPSSMHRLTLDALRDQAATGEVWAIGIPPCACVVFTLRAHALYIGKLVVRADSRRRGLARALIGLAAGRARHHHRPLLELQTRVELAANQAAFEAMGFVRVAATAHQGYDRPTSYTYQKEVQP